MTNEDCFAAWAPETNPWSGWAKPALFCHLAAASAAPAPPDQGRSPGVASPGDSGGAAGSGSNASAGGGYDASWIQDPRGRTAVIVDLPGSEAVRAGLALATRGYRPVPLFNTSIGPSSVIDASPIALALLSCAEALLAVSLPPDAAPAFLLDSNRTRPQAPPAPGKFDNRWIVFPQDFPSANYLQASGIGEILLLQREPAPPADDLAHVLLRWQQAGMRLTAIDAQARGRPRDLTLTPPSRFRRTWYRALALAGFQRNDAGGFGSIIPLASSSGG